MATSLITSISAAEAVRLVGALHQQQLDAERLILEAAAHWADLHHPDSHAATVATAGEQSVLLGGEGTPEVLEFAAVELGAALQTNARAARSLMADALDLRHRLPRCWAKVTTGGAPVWQARKIAQATRHLSREAAGRVDAAVAGALGMIGWGRLETVLVGRIIEADPAEAARQVELWERERFVRAGRTRRTGLKLLTAQADAADVTLLMASVNRIAEILRYRGDYSPMSVVRARALGVLAQPAHALQLLWDHRDQRGVPPDERTADVRAGEVESVDRPPLLPAEFLDPPDDESEAGDEDLFTPEDLAWLTEVWIAHDALGPPRTTSPEPVEARPALTSPESDTTFPEPVEGPPDPRRTVDNHGHPDTSGLFVCPPPVEAAKLRPRAVLYVHVSAESLNEHVKTGRGAVARVEQLGPMLLDQVRRFLAGDSTLGRPGYDVHLYPVVDLSEVPAPVDAYEVPARLRDHLALTVPASVFPYSPTVSRRVDLDHTVPYRRLTDGGPPGQTAAPNLGPLSRSEHRVKTHGRWRTRQPSAGVHLWRSPHGAVYLVTAQGTQPLGDTAYADAVWRAAQPGRLRVPARST